MEQVAISVLVPVYNVEDTLQRCLDSILAQTFKDYEIILVDDGSTDNSGTICDQFAEQYSFVRVIHKENEGLGPTRNVGVKHARGKYVYHCDSDDWIEPNLLEDCYNAAEKTNANIVIFGYTIHTEKEKIEPYQTISVNDGFYEKLDEARTFFAAEFENSFVVQSACNRLLKREFLIENDIWFKPFRRCQDIVFSLDLFHAATRVCCLKKSYYNYIIVPGVYKGRSFDEMLSIYLDVYKYVYNAFQTWNLWNEETKRKIVNLYMAHIANYVGFYVTAKSEKPYDDIKKLIQNDEVSKLFSQNVEITSKFIRLVQIGVRIKSIIFLKWIFYLHEKRK